MIPLSYLVGRVLLLVNEMNPQQGLAALGEHPVTLKNTVSELMCDAVLFVQQNKRFGVLNPGVYKPDASQIADNGDGSGTIMLPSDFVALVKLQLEGWERPCRVLYPQATPIAMAQGNVETRAGASKPVCVEDVDDEGRSVVAYYSLPKGVAPVVKSFVYEKEFDPQTGLATTQSNPLLWAVLYQCAGLLYNVYEKRESANAFMALAQVWCNKINEK